MTVDFYIYFNSEEDGKKIIPILEKEGFRLGHYNTLAYAGKTQWSLLVTKNVESEEEIDKLEEMLAGKSSQFNGEYDGYCRATDAA